MKQGSIYLNNRVLILIALTVLVTAAVFMAGPITESAVYHDFADKRPIGGIPNFLNVISNLGFVAVGVAGLIRVGRTNARRPILLIYATLFAGVLLTGLGSAWYHLHPDNASLVYDRLPMTIVFMSLLAATISEFIDRRVGGLLLAPLLIIGAGSVWWWHYTGLQGVGDLRLYVLVQYYPMLLIPLILVFFPALGNKGVPQLVRVIVWYLIAKAFDVWDRPVYSFTGFVSGHTLKHLAAAMATLYLVRLFQSKYLLYDTQ